MSVTDVNLYGTVHVIWLPLEAQAGVWESPTRLLLRTRYGGGHLRTPLLRVDVTTRTFERVPLPGIAEYDPLPITPALAPA